MKVYSVSAVNYNSNNSKQPSFEKAKIDESFKKFLEAQVQMGLANVKNQRGSMTKKQIRSCEASLRYFWYQSYNALQNKANQMSDDIVISVKQTRGSIYNAPIFNTLSAKNTKTGKSKELIPLVELSRGTSHYVGKDKFKWLIEKLDPSEINEKLAENAPKPRNRYGYRSGMYY